MKYIKELRIGERRYRYKLISGHSRKHSSLNLTGELAQPYRTLQSVN